LHFENTINLLHALLPDPSYDGFLLSVTYWVRYNDITVAQVWTLRTISPLLILIIKGNYLPYFSTLLW
jgi:hypothetical protein